MKHLWPLIIPIIFSMACQGKKGFEIQGNVKGQKEGKLYFVNLQTEKQDTVMVKNGKFSLKGTTDEPTPFLIFSPEILPAQTIFYAANGKTQLEFTANEPSTLKISGSKTQKEYEQFASITKPMLAQFDSIQMLAMAKQLTPQEVQELAAKIQKEYEVVNLNFVKKHPDSYVSALLAYEYLRQKPQLSTPEKSKLVAALNPEIQQSFFGKKMAELIHVDEMSTTALGKEAPTFTLPSITDKQLALTSFRGKYVLIDFWASWCQPCRAENPNVVQAYNKFKNKNFTVLGVSLDENKKQWAAAVAQDKLNWSQVSDLKGWNSSIVQLYNIKSIPSNVLIDPNGKIIAKDLRGVDLENQLSNLLK